MKGSPVSRLILLSTLLLVYTLLAQLHQNEAFIYVDEGDSEFELDCDNVDEAPHIEELGHDCRILKFFNQTQVDEMEFNELIKTIKNCSCQLSSLWLARWNDFSDLEAFHDLAAIVNKLIYRDDKYQHEHPKFLWSDTEVVGLRISIYTATKDYFEQVHQHEWLRPERAVSKHEYWRLVKRVCRRIANDEAKLYRYLENVNRVSRDVFMRLISYMEPIEIVYQASKACKLLVLVNMDQFKLRPDNDLLVPVDLDEASLEYSLEHNNNNNINNNNLDNVVDYDVDRMLKQASALLMNCNSTQSSTKTLDYQDLNSECPMMVGNEKSVIAMWLTDHPTTIERTKAAISCACQLLLHNSTWVDIMNDQNVMIMSKMLTNYMNRQRLPDFQNSPIFVIENWFREILNKFSTRQATIKEVVKTTFEHQDPLRLIKKSDDQSALELIRRACNYIVFNYKKGSKLANELKLIKYLDNLQLISQDPLFVFQLTLQDPNLFKLHALSKICQPIVKQV